MANVLSLSDVCGYWAGKIYGNEMYIVVRFTADGICLKTIYTPDFDVYLEMLEKFEIIENRITVTSGNGNTSEYTFSDPIHLSNGASLIRRI